MFDAQPQVTEIDLESVNVVAPLQRRFDRKFLLDENNLERLVPKLLEHEEFDWRLLTIEQEREFFYSTTYFDDNLLTYWDHLKGKRLRFKIRSREYPNNGPVMLEVKTTDSPSQMMLSPSIEIVGMNTGTNRTGKVASSLQPSELVMVTA